MSLPSPILTEPVPLRVNIVYVDANWSTRFDWGDMQTLAESIRGEGLKEPIIVVREAYNIFRLIHGERRLRACAAQPTHKGAVPIVQARVLTEEQPWSEQAARLMQPGEGGKALLDLEKAYVFRRLVDDYGYSDTQLAAWAGMEVGRLSQLLAVAAAQPGLPHQVRTGRFDLLRVLDFNEHLGWDQQDAARLEALIAELSRQRERAFRTLTVPWIARR